MMNQFNEVPSHWSYSCKRFGSDSQASSRWKTVGIHWKANWTRARNLLLGSQDKQTHRREQHSSSFDDECWFGESVLFGDSKEPLKIWKFEIQRIQIGRAFRRAQIGEGTLFSVGSKVSSRSVKLNEKLLVKLFYPSRPSGKCSFYKLQRTVRGRKVRFEKFSTKTELNANWG